MQQLKKIVMKMKTEFAILLVPFLLIFSEAYSQNCSTLADGKYEIYYDSSEKLISTFVKKGNEYYFVEDNIEKTGTIINLDKCNFRFENDHKMDDDKITEIQRLLSAQKNYYEISKVDNDTYYFICRVNLHVNCGTGKFLKIK